MSSLLIKDTFILISVIIIALVASQPYCEAFSGPLDSHEKPISNAYVPVFVMMPLNTVTNDGHLNNVEKLKSQLSTLRNNGVDGIMIDVWWGIVERNGPKQYDWDAYRSLVDIAAQLSLKVEAVMSFHKCGTNVGDVCYIPLPSFVVNDVGKQNPDIFYTDREGYRDQEYLSAGVDHEAIFPPYNRTAIDMYADFMSSFASNFEQYFGSVIVNVEVGLGPAGEMRYPSYQLQDHKWTFPGIGEFQCYDKYMLASLKNAASNAGHPQWGNGGPSNAGTYNNIPSQTGFFSNGFDNWSSDYGRFFLTWYSSFLIQHGADVLARAQQIFSSKNNTSIAAKISGIHWWYNTDSHAAELTAGYYNTIHNDGYKDISAMFKKYNTEFQFTCLEMQDKDQKNCGCSPERLVSQTRNDAWSAGIPYAGENALPSYSNYQYDQIVRQSYVNGRAIHAFTYLRLTDDLMNPTNLNTFKSFVSRMHNL